MRVYTDLDDVQLAEFVRYVKSIRELMGEKMTVAEIILASLECYHRAAMLATMNAHPGPRSTRKKVAEQRGEG